MDASLKPYGVAIIIQLIYTGMFVVSKAAFDHDMSSYLTLNLYHVSLKFTSATVASATDNSAPAITFFLALLLRMEHVKLKSWSGIAKLTGVALCLAGVLVIALYTGPGLSPANHHRAFPSHASGPSPSVAKTLRPGGAWVKWTFLMVVANVAWSLWIVMHAVLKEYPNKMLVTAVQCVFSSMQSFAVAAVAKRDFSRWKLRLDVSLLAIFYSVSGSPDGQ
uniref:WAT1-related protein n=1 Tax=Setaria viridis TaxID=4556 RepID=A0A4U6VC80_SETVI|nr:hypothetical protein SEVIR_3G070100v2 [Setaria viridis]